MFYEEKSLDLFNSFISNIHYLKDSTTLRTLSKLFSDAGLPVYSNLLEGLYDYYQQNKTYPSLEYLISRYSGIVSFTEPVSELVFEDLHKDLKSSLDRLSLVRKTEYYAKKGDFQAIKSLLSSVFSDDFKLTNFSSSSVWQDYKRVLDRPAGITTGIFEVDTVIKGFGYGEIHTIASSPGCGKTSFCISTVYQGIMKDSFNFLVITLEATFADFHFRLISRHAASLNINLPYGNLKKGLLSDSQKKQLDFVITDFEKNKKGNLVLVGSNFTDYSYESLKGLLKKVKATSNSSVDVLCIDFVQLLKYFKPSGLNETLFVNEVIRNLERVAIEYDKGLVVILLSQVNREGLRRLEARKNIRRYSLVSLAEFNELERASSTVLVLDVSDEQRRRNEIDIAVLKNRSGVTDEVFTVFADFSHSAIGTVSLQDVYSLESYLGAREQVSSSDDELDLFQ